MTHTQSTQPRTEKLCQLSLAQSSRLFRMSRMVIKKQEESAIESEVTRVKPPPLYKVMLLNDDFTPMDFVVAVIQKFFAMDREQATRIMLKVHREGVGVCGVFPRDIAATKVEQVIAYARQHQHPLACVMEEN
jgi:ATP-dependent Clp protease adaptor protein ClpS